MPRIACLLLLPLLPALLHADPARQAELTPLRPIAGALILAGEGPLHAGVPIAVVRLGGGESARVVVLGETEHVDSKRWKQLGASRVDVLRLGREAQLREREVLLPLLSATAVWLEADLGALRESPLARRLLANVLARGGVVAGKGAGALALAEVGLAANGKPTPGFGLLPRSLVSTTGADAPAFANTLAARPGAVGWALEREAALLVHGGRRVGVIGEAGVTAALPARGEWAARSQRLEAALYLERWDELPYQADLLAWTRAAALRQGPLFPPKKAAPAPRLTKGTLILSGGRRVSDDSWARFIAAAGGKRARIVCIPTGAQTDPSRRPSSYSARQLSERGCQNLTVLSTLDRRRADREPAFLAALERATGVWIDGGRTFRLMDAYQHTRAHALMRRVLERGGVIGGSSAGAQVQGDFLMRGHPASNRPLWWPGYQTGFGFLRGVIIDAHFRQREREKTFPEVVRRFPSMLGVGVDENTSLIVSGGVGEVTGEHAVSFFDFKGERPRTHVLRAGARYDLVARKPLPKGATER